MQVLGYTATWPTECFIAGGCGKRVFAHTNGFGDFVLFDKLGWPWPIHHCYEDRFVLGGLQNSRRTVDIREDRIDEYRRTQVPTTLPQRKVAGSEIRAVDPLTAIGRGDILVAGYVQDYFERRADKLAAKMGTLGHQTLNRVLGTARSQLTIVTTEFKSYTLFADLRDVVVRRKDMVLARIRAVRAVGIRDVPAVFLADEIILVHGMNGATGLRQSPTRRQT
jgi:hypothetical protein